MEVVVAAWVGSTNLGDELVFSGLSRRLAGLGVDVTAVSVAPAHTRSTHGVAAVDHRNLPELIRAGRRADAVVLGGGGLLQDRTSAFNLPYHLSRLVPAHLARTPLGVVGIGAGPLRGKGARWLVGAALSRAVACTARDQASADLLRSLGVDDVVVAADLALSLSVPEGTPEDHLVACLRPWRSRRRRLPVAVGSTPGQAEPWFVAGAAAALDAAAAATGLGVRLVALQGDRDGPLHDQVAEAMATPVTTVRPGVDEVVAEVASGRVVVAMRYHALVAAVLGGRPAVALGYDPKVDALAGDIGAPAVAALGADRSGVAGVAAAVERLAGGDYPVASEAMVQARTRLRGREQANGAALERLLEA